jgi:LysR family transcriptional activator of nhaA
MDWLNYHHLLYFWTVAREGTVAAAADRLRLAQPTVSAQVKMLEQALGEQLFARSGRTLQLTDVGRLVFRYADEIFTLGRELQDTLKGRPTGQPARLAVGVANALGKLVAFRLLAPALALEEPVRVVCHEEALDALLARLALHELDVVLTDAPVPPSVRVKAFTHQLGECGVSVFAAARLARGLRGRFPASLDGAPWLLPSEGTQLRRALDQWFDGAGVWPRVVGEFDDPALMKTFGEAAVGVFAAPSVIEQEVCAQYHVTVVGRLDEVRERFYAISVERRLKHPAVVAISAAARADLGRGEAPAGGPRVRRRGRA